MNNKIIKLQQVLNPNDLGKKRILVGGCFDILHLGHIRLLTSAKKIGGSLIVVLESDRHIIEVKKRQPVHSQNQRAEILSAVKVVDIIILLPYLQGFDQYFQMVQILKPHFIAVENKDFQLQNKIRQAKKIKAKVVKVTRHVKTISTSLLTTKNNSRFV